MMRIFAAAAIFAFLFSAVPVQAASDICFNDPCEAKEVGPFMQGISKICGNTGTCQLTDIETVFANIGNWILGIVGAVVLIYWVYGGMLLITGGGMHENIKKGKQALTISSIGLVIVFVGYAAIHTLVSAIGYEGLTDTPIDTVTCGPGEINAGLPCGDGDNKVCSTDGQCITECANRHPQQEGGAGGIWSCVDTDLYGDGVDLSCETGYCPGAENIQCCQVAEEHMSSDEFDQFLEDLGNAE